MKSYRILCVADFRGRENPLGYCPNWKWIADCLEELGHKVKRMPESEVSAEDVLAEVKNGYDFILTEEARLKNDHINLGEKDGIFGYFREVMVKSGLPIVAWLTNIFYSVPRREEHIRLNPVFKADIVFSTDGGHQKEFESAGVNHILLRQGIYLQEAYLGKPIYPTKAEIGFIGSIYEHIHPYRKKLVDFLKQTYGERFEHFGQRGEVRHDDLNNLCATLKIVVGDSVQSPYYWSNRIYEIIGRGGFFIHQFVEGLEEEFIPYKHFVPYKYGDFQNLKRVIDYYLENDKEREKIRLNGFKHCRKKHTYQERVKKLLQILEERKII